MTVTSPPENPLTPLSPISQVNPLMSMWMSTVNQSMGAARGLAMAELQRQATAMQIELGKQILDFWVGAWTNALKPPDNTTAPRTAKAELQPQGTAMQADLAKQIVDFWTGGWMKAPSPERGRR